MVAVEAKAQFLEMLGITYYISRYVVPGRLIPFPVARQKAILSISEYILVGAVRACIPPLSWTVRVGNPETMMI